MKKIIIGSDHGGFEKKEEVKKILGNMHIEIFDVGTFEGENPVDYPDIAQNIATEISQGKSSYGILLCGSGIGMSIVANKFPSVRAALCYSKEAARLSRAHNDANILVLPGRLPLEDELEDIVKTWLDTDFEEGRHLRRIKKIKNIEKERDLS
ncbi:MAG TPA: ribose 5-phosphate isomerase B [Candidatus Eremiobacteraeota bacterium]|nr:MAG: Ribose-5-phosphate isomerase B [bacterium ADurb.Bin363]HPZ09668.1 ribose 5-phosphate isomerase B [Candidatus Eremiobacteraeota bacterium]